MSKRKASVALFKRTRRRILTKRPFVQRTKKASSKASITRGQKRAIEKLINEDVFVKDVSSDMGFLTTAFTAITPDGDDQGGFFKCPANQVVAGSSALEGERTGLSIKAMNMDLRVSVTADSKHQQLVRLILVQFKEGGSFGDVLQTNTFDPNQPMSVIRSFRKRKPDNEYTILADKIITFKPHADGSSAGSALQSRTKYCRFYHKFDEKGANMIYNTLANDDPVKNVVYLYACYATARQGADGSAFGNNQAPTIHYQCRQRYMK